MARAYKCDRCGILFESYDHNLNPTKDHREDYILEIKRKGRYSNAHDKSFDLCPECYEKFANFIECYAAESEDKE